MGRTNLCKLPCDGKEPLLCQLKQITKSGARLHGEHDGVLISIGEGQWGTGGREEQ